MKLAQRKQTSHASQGFTGTAGTQEDRTPDDSMTRVLQATDMFCLHKRDLTIGTEPIAKRMRWDIVRCYGRKRSLHFNALGKLPGCALCFYRATRRKTPCANVLLACWAEAPIKIARMTLTIKLDRNWNSFQLANSAPPLSVTDSAIAPSARIKACTDRSTIA